MGADQLGLAAAPFVPPRRLLQRLSASTAITVAACLLGLAILGLFRYAGRFGLDVRWLFAKEGPLELLTFVAEIAASTLLILTGRKALAASSLYPYSRAVALCYFVAAAILFAVGMEEIGWGQQFFHFTTPALWAQLNYQQETTLHNLLDRDALETSARWVAYAVVFGALVAAAVRASSTHALVRWITPSHGLLSIALLIGVAGWKTHSEVVEVLIAMYALCYACDVYARIADENALQRSPATTPKISGLFALRKPLRDRIGR
jgi:hypothetical protein